MSLFGIFSAHGQEETQIDSNTYTFSITANRLSNQVNPEVKVINQNDIQKSGAQNVSDLLRMESQVRTQQSLDGSSSISFDLAGFGATADNNTLILLDGRVVSSADLATLPLSSIEQIEIMPHGTAALYGANTTGGVIQVITRSPLKRKPIKEVKMILGAYGDFRRDFILEQTSQDQLASVRLSGNQRDTDGYRKNAAATEEGYQFETNLQVSQNNLFKFGQNYARLKSQLPGALVLSDFIQDPTKSDSKNWGLSHHTNSYLSFQHDQDNIKLRFDAAQNSTNAYSIYAGSLYSPYTTTSQESTINPRGEISYLLGTIKSSTQLGMDRKISESSSAYSSNLPTVTYQDFQGYYLQQAFNWTNEWSTQIGYRQDELIQSRGNISTKDKPESSNIRIGFSPTKDQSYWFVWGKSKRFPTADDNNLTKTTGQLLQIQSSKDTALGGQWKTAIALINAELFQHHIENEIAFVNIDPTVNLFGGYNTNLPNTIHKGWKVSAKWFLSDEISLTTAYSLVKATFASGSQIEGTSVGGNYIPSVPKEIINLGLEWNMTEQTSMNTFANYRGRSYVGGDWQNELTRQPSIWLLDWNLVHQLLIRNYNITLQAGVRNLTNKNYYSSAFLSRGSTYVYSERPREVFVGASVKF
jgi:iron complex outermembrane receptor protein